jgi:DNA-binding response OmpR family regulator
MAGRTQSRVLVVEDNDELRALTLDALRHAGYDPREAGTLEEARVLADRTPPDLVLLDARLPDGDGLELAREWSSSTTMNAVPVIVWTASSSRQDLEAALLARVAAYLVKPCTWPVLKCNIERVLAKMRQKSAQRETRSPVGIGAAACMGRARNRRVDET